MPGNPNLTQFFGETPQPSDGPPDPTLAFDIPSPWANPNFHDSIVFVNPRDSTQAFTIPPVGMGKVEVKTPWKVKIDSKGGAGKAKPRTTKTGGDTIKASMKLKDVIDQAWPYIRAASIALVPGSGPWLVVHPKLMMCNFVQCMVGEWKDAPDEDAHGFIQWELELSQVDPNAQQGDGGKTATDTPDSADNQRDTGDTVIENFGGIPGNTVRIPNSATAPAKSNPNTPFSGQQNNAGKA